MPKRVNNPQKPIQWYRKRIVQPPAKLTNVQKSIVVDCTTMFVVIVVKPVNNNEFLCPAFVSTVH